MKHLFSIYEYDHYGGNRPDGVDCPEPDNLDGYLDVTSPPEPVKYVTDGMTYQEKIDIVSGSVNEPGYVPIHYRLCGGLVPVIGSIKSASG